VHAEALDRVLFCAFCEDRQLLPSDTVQGAFSHSDPYNPKPIWENFRGLFRAVDRGNAGLKNPRLHGGLFAADAAIDALLGPDDVCALFRDLAGYDYRPAAKSHGRRKPAKSVRLSTWISLGHILRAIHHRSRTHPAGH